MANDADHGKPLTKASDFPPEVLILFDEYVHGVIDRRGFLDGRGQVRGRAGSPRRPARRAVSPRFAEAQQVRQDDPRLKAESVEFPSPHGYGKARGYLVARRRRQGGRRKLPAILVVHENRGLNPHIEDIARRLALDGFMAFAPDALFPLGGYPGDEDKARELFAKLDQAKTREDFVAAAGFLQARARTATASWARSASATAAASSTCSPRGCPISRPPCPSTARAAARGGRRRSRRRC